MRRQPWRCWATCRMAMRTAVKTDVAGVWWCQVSELANPGVAQVHGGVARWVSVGMMECTQLWARSQ